LSDVSPAVPRSGDRTCAVLCTASGSERAPIARQDTIDSFTWLVIGKIADRHWAAVITYREQRVRIVSARRARKEERALYEG